LSPATSWTEKSQAASIFVENYPEPGSGLESDGFALLDIVIPLTRLVSFPDPTTPWFERVGYTTTYAEAAQSATTWVENTG
jgi:hypothetical protein